MKPELCFILIALTFSSLLTARQEPSIRGEVECSKCSPGLSLNVEVFEQIGHRLIERTTVRPAGDFELLQTPEGIYELQVVSSDGEVLKSYTGTLTSHVTLTVRVDLPERTKAGSGTISVARLRHKVPRKAVDQFRKAEKRLAAGDLAGSIECLRNSVAIDPDYMEAHNNLGVRYMKDNQPQQAVPFFRRAIELDPGIAMTHVNLAVALLKANAPVEAESAARHALQLDGPSVNARYVLGMSLFAQRKFTPETLENLKQVQKEFPDTRLVVAQLLLAQGQVELARTELKGYVSSGPPQRRKEVEGWLSRLK